MTIDERRRHEMYLSLEESLGREAADTLMQHLPPVGWAEVATKADIEGLRAATKADIEVLRVATKKDFESVRVEIESSKNGILAEMHRSLRNQALAMMTVFGVLNGVIFTALKLG